MYTHARTKGSQTTAQALDYFDKFCAADSLDSILSFHKKLCSVLDITPAIFPEFFPKLSATLTSADAQELLSKYTKRVSTKCYENGKACNNCKVLIIGAGPCGLRTAIDAQLLGAKVVLIEKRESFSRNNVLHLWPFVIADLKGLGAKKFYGKFCPGAIDHISISTLQLMLLKIALLIGVEVHLGVEFQNVIKPNTDKETNTKRGWRAKIQPSSHPLTSYEFDILIGADGRRNTLKGFKRKVLRGKLAIAITANFINNRSAAEAKVQEISGVSFIFKQDFFNELCQATGIDLENIVYYKDETHYFVMTAKKHSLLWKGVLYDDHAETDRLLSPDNVDRDALENYVIEAVNFATCSKLPNLKFALNYRSEPDVALIDFTEMYAAENACRVVQRKGYKLLLGLVGDSLLEPFWPTGSGCARGFLSSFDMCWTIRSWAKGVKNVTEVIAERESMYRLLAQSTHENLSKDHSLYTVEPQTRYPYINLAAVKAFQVQTLFDSDENQASVKLPSSSTTAPATKNKQLLAAAEKNKQSSSNSSSSGGSQRGKGSSGSNSSSAATSSSSAVTKTNKSPLPSNPTVAAHEENNKRETIVEEEPFPDIEEMLSWFRSQVQPYEIQVDGIQDVYVNGDVLCAIIHRFRPDLLPEFPLPPEVQQGNDGTEQASYRNQLAFDFLKCEYSLNCKVNGVEATQNVSSNLSTLIDFTVQVYMAFKAQKPQLIVKPQVNTAVSSTNVPLSENIQPELNGLYSSVESTKNNEYDKPKGYFSSCVWTSSSNFPQDDDNDSDTFSNASSRRIRRSSSIQRIVQRLDNNNCYNNPPPSYLPPPEYNKSFHNHFQQHPPDEPTHIVSPEVYANPYRTINNEMRRKRLEEAEQSKVETLKMMHLFNTHKKEERDEERAEERQRIVRALRAQQVHEPEEPTSPTKAVEQDDFFNEYNLRLWRKSKPSMTERTQTLETKLFNTGLERTSSFCSQPPVRKLEPPPQFRQGLVRSATERHVKGNACLPAAVQKYRMDESKVASMRSKLSEGHGHTSVNTYFEPKTQSNETLSKPQVRGAVTKPQQDITIAKQNEPALKQSSVKEREKEKEPTIKQGVTKEKEPATKRSSSKEKESNLKQGVAKEKEPAMKQGSAREMEPAIKQGVREKGPNLQRGISKEKEPILKQGAPKEKEPIVKPGAPKEKEPSKKPEVAKPNEPTKRHEGRASSVPGKQIWNSASAFSIYSNKSSRDGISKAPAKSQKKTEPPAAVVTKQPEPTPQKKKNDFSEYFLAKELAKSKSTSSFAVTRARSDVGSAQSIHAKAKLLTESPRQEKAAELQASKLRRSMQNEGLNPGMKLQMKSEPEPVLQPERTAFKITAARPHQPPRVARQSTVDEFEELYGISEHDEAVLADLNSDELNLLLDWTEKTFSTRKGVELE